MKKIVFFMIVLFLFSSISYTQFLSGNDLYRHLGNIKDVEDMNREEFSDYILACGYIMGVWDVHCGDLWISSSSVNSGQVKDIAKKYLEEHPERRHFTAASLLKAAFKQAFPKKKEEDKKGG